MNSGDVSVFPVPSDDAMGDRQTFPALLSAATGGDLPTLTILWGVAKSVCNAELIRSLQNQQSLLAIRQRLEAGRQQLGHWLHVPFFDLRNRARRSLPRVCCYRVPDCTEDVLQRLQEPYVLQLRALQVQEKQP